MRVLMLHGHGTNAFIFKAQTGPFRSKLDKTFEFDFINGPYPCAPPKALKSVISTAHAWITGTDTGSIREAANWLTDYIDKNGPYDCICCFSKASAVVAAMLLGQGTQHEKVKEQVRSVVFMNGSIEYSVLEEIGMQVTDTAREIKFKTEELVISNIASLPNLAMTVMRPGARDRVWNSNAKKLMHDTRQLPSEADCFGLDFTTLSKDDQINIPTVHIVGAKDPIWPSAIQLAYLCDPAQRKIIDHGGGHDIPRMPKVSTEIAKVFRELAKK